MVSYLCKSCPENNNGWCKKRKIQNLKSITECEFRHSEDKSPSIVDEFSSDSYKNMGKREMFYDIQRQMIAIDKLDKDVNKFEQLKKAMISLEQILSANESFGGIALEFMLDRDVLESSKQIIKGWNNVKK